MQETIELQVRITQDSLQIGNHPPHARPLCISPTRWVAFWKHTAVTGFDVLAISRFMSGQWHLSDDEMLELIRNRVHDHVRDGE